MIFQDKEATAKQLGVSVHSVIKYICRDIDALPSLKSKANKVRYKNKTYDLPEGLQSGSNQRKLIFIREEVEKWSENQY